MKRWIFSFGQAGLISDQVEAVLNSFASSSLVRFFTNVFWLLTTTARASVPTRNSMGLRPICLAASISLAFMARLALAISVSPATVNRSKPAPLPIESMVITPLYPSCLKRSAIRSDNGYTVELPAVMIFPLTFSGLTPGRPATPPSSTHEKVFFCTGSGSFAPPAKTGSVIITNDASIAASNFFIVSSILGTVMATA